MNLTNNGDQKMKPLPRLLLLTTILFSLVCLPGAAKAGEFRPDPISSNLTAGTDFDLTLNVGADKSWFLTVVISSPEGSSINAFFLDVIRPITGLDPTTNLHFTTGIYTGQTAKAVFEIEDHLVTGDRLFGTNLNQAVEYDVKISYKRGN